MTASCHGHSRSDTTPAADIVECPVMPGSFVAKQDAEAAGLIREFEGTRYHLCCASCGPKFDADPARYATTH